MKTILITGAAQGIGAALKDYFYQAGYQVIATDIDIETLQKIASERLLVHALDVTKPDQWESLFSTITQLDIIINNAGIIIPGFMAEISIFDASSQIDVNLKGVIYGSTFAAKLMTKQGFGHIINVASLAGLAPIQGLAVYAATKAAVRSFTLSIAAELKTKGVSTSVVCPDLVDTNMLTLQLDYPAAALTFSGNQILTKDNIVDAIIHRGLKNKELEILIPRSRGWLGKIGNLFPASSQFLTNTLSKKGLSKIELLKKR